MPSTRSCGVVFRLCARVTLTRSVSFAIEEAELRPLTASPHSATQGRTRHLRSLASCTVQWLRSRHEELHHHRQLLRQLHRYARTASLSHRPGESQPLPHPIHLSSFFRPRHWRFPALEPFATVPQARLASSAWRSTPRRIQDPAAGARDCTCDSRELCGKDLSLRALAFWGEGSEAVVRRDVARGFAAARFAEGGDTPTYGLGTDACFCTDDGEVSMGMALDQAESLISFSPCSQTKVGASVLSWESAGAISRFARHCLFHFYKRTGTRASVYASRSSVSSGPIAERQSRSLIRLLAAVKFRHHYLQPRRGKCYHRQLFRVRRQSPRRATRGRR